MFLAKPDLEGKRELTESWQRLKVSSITTFDDQMMEKVEKGLAELEFPRIPDTLDGLHDVEWSDLPVEQFENYQRLCYLILDNELGCAMGAIKRYFSFLNEESPDGKFLLSAVGKVVLLEKLRCDLGLRWGRGDHTVLKFKPEVEEWCEEFKNGLGIGVGALESIKRKARQKIEVFRAKTEIQKNYLSRRHSPYHIDSLLVIEMRPYEIQATYEALKPFSKKEADCESFLKELDNLEYGKCLSEAFRSCLYDQWEVITKGVFAYFNRPGTDAGIILDHYEVSGPEGQRLIWETLRAAFANFSLKYVKPVKATSPYRV